MSRCLRKRNASSLTCYFQEDLEGQGGGDMSRLTVGKSSAVKNDSEEGENIIKIDQTNAEQVNKRGWTGLRYGASL
jgi:hypothetical protein